MSENLYEILGVAKDASESDIKRAFRALSLIYHPDRNTDQDDQTKQEKTEKFKEISSAYETLKSADTRKQYDMESQGFGGFRGGPMSSSDEMNDINQLFGMLFGQGGMSPMGGMHSMHTQHMGHMGGGGMPEIRIFHGAGGGNGRQMFMNMQKPPPIIKNITISMEQCFRGADIPVDIEKWIYHNGMKVSEIQTIYVHIPPGIQDNEIVILRDCGNESNDELKGDIKIGIKIQNTTQFIRVDMDLLFTKQITLKEALCGFSFDVTHLNGKLLALNNKTNPTIVKPHYKKVVTGLGMMNEAGNFGNLIIEFDVKFPESLTSEQTEGLNNIL
jgi:DnaJ-class molecular chaperone